MNNRQRFLVQASFEQVRPVAAHVAAAFYRRLLELDPSLKPLLSGDAREQERRLMRALQAAVGGLYRLERVVPALRGLVCRHAVDGIQPGHYRTMAAALLWALENRLGQAFTPEVKVAWAAGYALVEETLRVAGAEGGAAHALVRTGWRALGQEFWPAAARPAWGAIRNRTQQPPIPAAKQGPGVCAPARIGQQA